LIRRRKQFLILKRLADSVSIVSLIHNGIGEPAHAYIQLSEVDDCVAVQLEVSSCSTFGGATTFGVTTFPIMTFSIMSLNTTWHLAWKTLSINDTQ